MKLYEAVKAVQDEIGYSTKDCAKAIGIDPSHLSRIRSGTMRLSSDMIEKMLEVLEAHTPGSQMKVWLMMAYGESEKVGKVYGELRDRAVLKETIKTLDQQELAELMKVMADRFHELNRKPSEPDPPENGDKLHATLR